MDISIQLVTIGEHKIVDVVDLMYFFESVTGFDESTEDELITADDIIEVVADCSGRSVQDILGGGLKRDLTIVRQIAMYTMFLELEMSYSAIGRKMGRHHSTVMHAISSIERALNSLCDGKLMAEALCLVKAELIALADSRKHG